MIKNNYIRQRGLAHKSAILLCVSTFPVYFGMAHAQENSETSECSIIAAPGATLINAKDQFAEQCPGQKREDCDRIDGVWQCSTQNLPAKTENPTTNPETTPTSNASCSATGSTLRDAIQAYNTACPTIVRKDCDPIKQGNWLCASERIRNGSVVIVDTPKVPTMVDIPKTPETPLIPVTPETPVDGPLGLFSDSDLLALHYDNCPDRDDGHSMVAGKAVVESVGINNIMVVNGTCGADIKFRYQKKSPEVANAVWGNSWLDGFNDELNTINAAADRWATTVSNNNDVWVAEGGPSDFTANVLRRMQTIYPSVDLKRVHVVQHSGWNENQTTNAGLSLVKRLTDYIRIVDGNTENNGTAGFKTVSNSFVNIALQSRYASEWEAAFDYLNPNDKLDFSDTVELMHIVGDTETLDVDDFADRYLR